MHAIPFVWKTPPSIYDGIPYPPQHALHPLSCQGQTAFESASQTVPNPAAFPAAFPFPFPFPFHAESPIPQ